MALPSKMRSARCAFLFEWQSLLAILRQLKGPDSGCGRCLYLLALKGFWPPAAFSAKTDTKVIKTHKGLKLYTQRP